MIKLAGICDDLGENKKQMLRNIEMEKHLINSKNW